MSAVRMDRLRERLAVVCALDPQALAIRTQDGATSWKDLTTAAEHIEQLLEAFARQHLTAYRVPTDFRFLETLPRTPSLKVCRPELMALLRL